MAEPQAVRNARAVEQLRAMGLDPGPLRGAANRLRKARGIAKGYTASQAVGRPRVGERSVSGRVHEPGPARVATRRGSQPHRDVTFAHGKGRIVQSVDQRYIRAQLRQAGQRGERVSLRITARDSQGIKTRVISGTPDQQASIAGKTGEGGGGKEADFPGVEIVGKLQLTFSSDTAVFDQGSGFDPSALLDYLDDYDDFWDAFGDLWADEYLDS